jgi:hypothetical protein
VIDLLDTGRRLEFPVKLAICLEVTVGRDLIRRVTYYLTFQVACSCGSQRHESS